MNKLAITLSICLASCALAFAQTVDYASILKRIDDMSNFKNQDFSSNATIVTDRPGKDREVVKVKFFRRDSDDKFLVVTIEPEVQKGEGILKFDDNVWFYDPNTRDFSHTSLKERFGGSGANNDDFSSRSLAEDYRLSEGKEDMLGKIPVYVLGLEARNNRVPYAFMRLSVTRDMSLILKQEEFSLSRKLMRTSLYTDYSKIGGRFIPLKQLFVDNITIGEKTQLSLSAVNLGAIPDEVFTKSYLEKVSN
jgi:outer membrane lipoprotein-sorting protein